MHVLTAENGSVNSCGRYPPLDASPAKHEIWNF